MKTAISVVARSAVDLLFPARCVSCGAGGELLCDECISNSARLEPTALCRKCALPSRADICERCFNDPPDLDRALAAYQYDGPMRDAVLSLKYDDLRAIASRLGKLMAAALPAKSTGQIDLVASVPMTSKRVRSRGYNQSSLLARHVAKAIDAPFDEHSVRKTRNTQPQVEMASETERVSNLIGAFTASEIVKGKRVLLVDDVMTTGSTLNACAAELKRMGASRVSGLTLCREL